MDDLGKFARCERNIVSLAQTRSARAEVNAFFFPEALAACFSGVGGGFQVGEVVQLQL